jgi:hypothetical protein
MNRLLLFISLALLLTSCRSSKITAPAFSKAPKANLLIDSVLASHFDFDWLSAKISGKFISEQQSFSFKGNIKVRKDSLIWMTLSPGLGVELGRILMDQDSIRFMNRLEKSYFVGSYSDLSKNLHSELSFERIQSLLLGNPLSNFEQKKYYSEVEDGAFSLNSVSAKQLKKLERNTKKASLELFFANVNPQTYRLNTQSIRNISLQQEINVAYEDFEPHRQQMLAESIDLSILAGENLVKMSLSYSKVNAEKELKFPFKVPKSYENIH